MLYHNSTILLILLSLSFWSATIIAGPIKTATENNPDQMINRIKSDDYASLLQLAKSAYAESKAENDEPVTQYVYMMAVDLASADKQVPLAVDFSLTRSDFDMKQMGARSITRAVLAGTNISATDRQRAIDKLKTELIALPQQREAYSFASDGANALIALGDQSGLSVFLTDNQIVVNYSAKDKWTPTSPPSLFLTLQNSYLQNAAASKDPNWSKLMAAVYGMCAALRSSGVEVKPVQPIVDLSKLLKQ